MNSCRATSLRIWATGVLKEYMTKGFAMDDEYSYQSIYVIQIALKISNQLTDLAIQLHSAFPEPTIILINYMDREWISVAPKRISKLD